MLKAIHQVCKELHIPLTQASRNLCHFGFGRRIQRHGKSPHIPYIRSNRSGLLNFDRKITLRFASDGYRINRWQGPDVLQLVYWQTPNSIDSCRNQRSQLTIRVWPVWVPAESRANRMLRNGSSLRSYNDCAGETEAGTAGTQPCRGISRWAHRDDERGRESSFVRRPTSIGS